MKVLVLTGHLNPGGVTTYCLVLGRSLKGMPHEALIASGGGRLEPDAARSGIRHFKAPLDTSSELNPRLLSAYRRLAALVEEENISLVHAQTRVAQVLAWALHKSRGVPWITTCHGEFKRRFFRRAMPLWGERVIAVSPSVERHLREDWGVDAGRIRVIPHGMEMPAARAENIRGAIRKKWGVPDDARVVGALGRLSGVKGFDVLVRAFGRLKDNNSLYLVIAGEGEEGPALRRLAEAGGLAERVKFTPYEETGVFFDAIDVLCAPSREEGFGLSILEAMRFGRPVIASRVGGIPDLVTDEITGLLVEPDRPEELDRAIRRLSGNPQERETFGAAGHARGLKVFSVDKMIRSTIQVYEEAIR